MSDLLKLLCISYLLRRDFRSDWIRLGRLIHSLSAPWGAPVSPRCPRFVYTADPDWRGVTLE